MGICPAAEGLGGVGLAGDDGGAQVSGGLLVPLPSGIGP
jgi:hypothetical protein